MTQKNYTVTLVEDPETGDLILPFPDEMMEELGWHEGDVLEWLEEDCQIVVRKKHD